MVNYNKDQRQVPLINPEAKVFPRAGLLLVKLFFPHHTAS